MYRYSRGLYRELLRIGLSPTAGDQMAQRRALLAACEDAIARLATLPHRSLAARGLFREVRGRFPLGAQAAVLMAIDRYVGSASEVAGRHIAGLDGPSWAPRSCRATTRKGTPCQRQPVAPNGYCPSHQHLAETEGSPFERALAAGA
jgi:hypothetical protein